MKIILIFSISILLSLSGCSYNVGIVEKNSSKISDDSIRHSNELKITELSGEKIKVPDCNSNTKVINIELPSQIMFSPYLEPRLTPTYDFKFGEYRPFVKYCVDSIGAERIPIYEYAFLGDKVTNLSVGNGLYTMLNHKYEKNYEIDNDAIFMNVSNEFHTKEYIDYFYKSRVVFISEDAKRIVNFSLINEGKMKDTDTYFWNQKLDIYENNQMIYSMLAKKKDSNDTIYPTICDFSVNNTVFNLQGILSLEKNSKIESILNYSKGNSFDMDTEHENVLRIPNNTNKLLTINNDEQALHIYSIEEVSEVNLDYVVKLPKDAEVNQYLNEDELIVTFNNYYNNENYYSETYLFNFNNLNMKYLGSYLTNPIISPDKKYLCYVKMHGVGSHECMNEINKLEKMVDGYYIKNLENEDITFYSVNDYEGYEYEVVCWVSEEGLENLLN